jgi:hypothetical protein
MIVSKDTSVAFKRVHVQFQCLLVFTQCAQVISETAGDGKSSRVAISENPAAARKCFLIDFTGLAVFATDAKVGGDMGRAEKRRAVVETENAPPAFESIEV